MANHKHPLPEVPELHDALFLAMRDRGLRLVEMDQIIYPEHEHQGVHFGAPSHSLVYLQVLDTHLRTLACTTYLHALSEVRSPFTGYRAIPGSARWFAMDDMAKTLESSFSKV